MIYYNFRLKNGYMEYHLGQDKDRVVSCNSFKQSMPVESPNYREWLKFKEKEICNKDYQFVGGFAKHEIENEYLREIAFMIIWARA